MNRLIISLLFVFFASNVFSQRQNQSYLDYIEKYKSLAIKEQYRHGIPASITMAQAIIESNAGQSMLAVKGKNHFGIKCGNNWTGKTIHKDDDNIKDCFRSYSEVIDSYEDHSLFLKRDRYSSLYAIPIKDYKAWANELKRLGYATDPNYANKLIKIIEDYQLDNLVYSNYSSDTQTADNTYNNHNTSNIAEEYSSYSTDVNDLLVATTNNGKKCYKLKKDATIQRIANSLNKTNIKTLLYYNDMYKDDVLKAGTFVYTSKKRNKADGRYRSYSVKDGDSMHSISQHFGITLKALYKLNNMPYGVAAEEGMILFLQ